jgi:inner membrane protein
VDNKEITQHETAYLKYVPADLNADVEIAPQIRNIGIFKVPVFTAKVKMKGFFNKPDSSVSRKPGSFISLEISDLRGIASTPVLNWDGKKVDFENALYGNPLTVTMERAYERKGHYNERVYRHFTDDSRLKILSAPAPLKETNMNYEIEFDIRGSNSISFVPLAKDNKFKIHSIWAHPNFIGSFLPDTREVSDKGFNANWSVNNLSSGIPAFINGYGGDFPFISVALMFPVDNYRNSERAVKYGILFIALTFLACFVFEIAGKEPVHPFQYLLVGLAMAVFYLLLVALSEFLGFALSYIISAAATIALITTYIRYAILRVKTGKILYATAGLGALYAYLYILLQLEDLSLILGTVGLFIGLAFIMYATRGINWYE